MSTISDRTRDVKKAMTRWIDDMPRPAQDALVIAVLAVPVYLVLLYLDAFDRFSVYSRAHEEYELDEFVSLLGFLGLAAIVFSIRRILDLRREMDQRLEAEGEAQRLARHDTLTGLPNRRRFIEEFEQQVLDAGPGTQCALILVDLDRFKPINDLYGHRLGDEVLRVIARRLTAIVDNNGIVARLGGDEFGIVMTVPKVGERTLRTARRIVYEVSKPIGLAALSLNVGASVGVAMLNPRDGNKGKLQSGESPVEIALRRADMAMYCAKEEGRRGYAFFDEEMDAGLQRRMRLETDIKAAIAAGQIVPYYQPLIDLHTRAVVGYELLSRWQHPALGVLEPSEFIPIAEDTGMIGSLSDCVFRQAFADAATWPPHIYLSVNLSPRQFVDPGLSQTIQALLSGAGLPANRLEVEITETAVVRRMDDAKRTLKSLRDLGVRIALDDFGTGYSGLHHLRELQLDAIKIDRSFVTHMAEESDDAKLVEAIVGLGRVLGLRTTAEGIETKDVMNKLIAMGCDTGQGFLFGRPEPMTASAVMEELDRLSA